MQQPPGQGQPQQPNTYYPPQQPGQYPMYAPPPPYQQRPPKKSRKRLWLIIGGIVLALVICGAISNASKSTGTTPTTVGITAPTDTPVPTATLDTSIPTSTPAPAPKWTTTHTYTGNGSKKTGSFAVPDDWQIVWKCDPKSFGGYNYNVIITVYNSDGTYADSGVNSTCSKSNTHDSTEIHTSGNVYLDVVSEGSWTIQVQELK